MTYNYNTIQRLKRAKFPNEDNTYAFDWYLYGQPSLSQLIKACSNVQFDLCCTSSGYCIWYQKKQQSIYKSPEEAVAQFWLTLNEKK